MLEELTQWATPSLGGVCATFVLLLMTGRLLPRSTVNKLLEQERQRAEDFKAAWQSTDARADKLTEQQEKLLTYAQTADAALRALRAAAERRQR